MSGVLNKIRTDVATIVFTNARLIDAPSGLDDHGGVIVENGKIAGLGPKITEKSALKGARHIDCKGLILCPGLIDMQVYVGEPGQEHKETLASASGAAAAGGVTTIITMPNANPVIDDIALVDFVARRARDTSVVHVHPMAALTKGLEGTQMTEIGLLKETGAIAFNDGGRTTQNAQLLRRVMSYSKQFDALLVLHAEDPDLRGDGVMNEGEVATRLGLSGIPDAAETIIVERDMRLAELTGARLHFAQLSARSAIDALRAGKARGLDISGGVSAAHLVLNENDIGSYRTFFKLSPPLRAEHDRQALVEGLRDGTIDVIISNHNPQSADTKRHPFAEAASGAIGLETLLPTALALYHNDDMPLARLIEAMTAAPARLLGLDTGRLEEGAPADLIVFDPDMPWTVHPENFSSKSKNTPFEDDKLQGRVMHTLVAGQTVYEFQSWA